MKIIHVPRRMVRQSWGGTETVVLESCKALQKMGHSCAIWCPAALSEPGTSEIEGVELRRFPYFYPYWNLAEGATEALDLKGGNLFSWQLFWALLTEPGLDLVHLHTGKRLGGIVRTACRLRKIPYVLSLHGGVYDVPDSEEQSFTKPTEKAIEWGKALGWLFGSRRVLGEAGATLCLGQRELEETRKLWPDSQPVLFPNGVDYQRFSTGDGPGFRRRHGIPESAFVVLSMGRIDPQKNQRLSLELLRDDPSLHLMLVGHVTNPSYQATLESFVAEHDLAGRLTWLPGISADNPDLVDAYHAADIFLLPSVHEPFGIVILEAWSAGLAVAASRVGGIPNFLEDGKDGLLFDPSDAQAAADALASLRDDPALRRRLAASGQAKARDVYSWQSVCQSLLEIYQGVMT